jgi:cell division protein FtsL
MDPKNQSSFIPKQPTRPIAPRRQQKRVAFPLFSMLGYAMFVGAIIAAIGMFIYNQYTEQQFAQAVTELDSKIQAFRIDDFNAVMQFNQRVVEAKTLLNQHASVDQILTTVETLAVQSLTFTEVSLLRENADTVVVSIEGTGTEFDFLIFQRDLLSGQTAAAVRSVNVEEATYQPEATESDEVVPKQIQFRLEVAFDARQFLTGTNAASVPAVTPDEVVSEDDGAVVATSTNQEQ